ncbi:MAG: hypothetical protein ACKVVT_17090 [Dehalococcoidia bacterium]
MYHQLIRSNDDLRAFARNKVYFPGDPEPESLRRAAEHARIFADEAIDRKVERLRSCEKRPNLVARLVLRRA